MKKREKLDYIIPFNQKKLIFKNKLGEEDCFVLIKEQQEYLSYLIDDIQQSCKNFQLFKIINEKFIKFIIFISFQFIVAFSILLCAVFHVDVFALKDESPSILNLKYIKTGLIGFSILIISLIELSILVLWRIYRSNKVKLQFTEKIKDICNKYNEQLFISLKNPIKCIFRQKQNKNCQFFNAQWELVIKMKKKNNKNNVFNHLFQQDILKNIKSAQRNNEEIKDMFYEKYPVIQELQQKLLCEKE